LHGRFAQVINTTMKDIFEIRTPFFRPLIRRIVVAGALAIWTAVELASAAWGWAAVFGASTLYVCWAFFIAFDAGPGGGDDA